MGFEPTSRIGGQVSQEDFDMEFWKIITRYGPWAIRTTPAINRRRAKRGAAEGDKSPPAPGP